MKKILLLHLLILSVCVSSFGQLVIGAAGNCVVDGDPNAVASLEMQDVRYECLKVYSDSTKSWYRYVDSLTVGNRWVIDENGGSGGGISDGITIEGVGSVGDPFVRSDFLAFQKESGGEVVTQKSSNYVATNLLSDIRSGELELVSESKSDNDNFGYQYGSEWDSDSIYVWWDGEKYKTNYDNTDAFREQYMFKGTGKTYYCNSVYGNDSNDGLSEVTPLRSIEAAKAKADVITIMVKSGNYYDTNGFFTAVSNDSINIIGYGGMVVTGSAVDRTFVQNWQYDNVYQTSYSGLTGVVSSREVDEFDVLLPYESVGSVAEVSQKHNSYYYGAGDTIYVNSSSQPICGIDLYLVRGISRSVIITTATANPAKVYIEGITVLGGCLIRADEAGNEFRANNCQFVHQYSSGNDGALQVQSIEKVHLNACIAAYSITDGLNYHDVGDYVTKPFVFENNCKIYSVGLDGGASDQASTLHEDYRAIRVNGSYYSNGQQVIYDVNSSWSVNLNTHIITNNNTVTTVGIGGDTGLQKIWLVNPILSSKRVFNASNSNCAFYLSGIDDYKGLTINGTGTFQIR